MSGRRFGEMSREYRKAAGLTLRKLATATGADFTYLSKIEHDRDRPSRDLVARIDSATQAGGRLLTAFDRLPCARCGVAVEMDWRDHLNAIRRSLVGTPPNVDSVDAAIGYALNDCEAAIAAALGEPPA